MIIKHNYDAEINWGDQYQTREVSKDAVIISKVFNLNNSDSNCNQSNRIQCNKQLNLSTDNKVESCATGRKFYC